ncbi:MAG: hypothetical protein QXY35_07815 [Thermofilaceae archaeon]
MRAQVVVLASVLAFTKSPVYLERGGEKGLHPRGKLVIWRDVSGLLSAYRIPHRVYVCRFTYTRPRATGGRGGRRRMIKAKQVAHALEVVEYRRVKIVVDSEKLAEAAKNLLKSPVKARRVFARYHSVVAEVVRYLKTFSAKATIYFYTSTLRRAFSLYYSARNACRRYLGRRLVEAIKPNWRKMAYVALVKTGALPPPG